MKLIKKEFFYTIAKACLLLFIVLAFYIYKSQFHLHWVWAAIAGFFTGALITFLIIQLPVQILYSFINHILLERLEPINKQLEQNYLQVKHDVIEAHFMFEKLGGNSGYLEIAKSIQIIPRVGEKLYLSNISNEPSLSNPWVSPEIYDKILELRPDVWEYEWTITEISWRPFYRKDAVIIVVR